MTRRLKFVLPIANLALAVILLGAAYAQPRWKWAPVPREMSVCFSINAPANLLRNLTYYSWKKLLYRFCTSESCIEIERFTEMGVFMLGVGFIWYMVGLEIEASRQRTRAMAGLRKSLRTAVNLLLLTVGTVLFFIAAANWRRLDNVVGSLYEGFCYLGWGLALIVVYGRDLLCCLNVSQ